jgi:CHAT domain-containing protein/tetratricopeptide (TPR) repeat protein
VRAVAGACHRSFGPASGARCNVVPVFHRLILLVPLALGAGVVDAAAGAIAPDPPTDLVPGTCLDRTASAGDVHPFTIRAAPGSAVAVTADQLGADVQLILTPSAGAPVVVDTPTRGARGPERLFWVTTGDALSIALRTTRTTGPDARYCLRAVILDPTDGVPAAMHALADTRALPADASSEAVERHAGALSAAVDVWRRVGDRERTAESLMRLAALQWPRQRRLADATRSLAEAADLFEALDLSVDLVEALQRLTALQRLAGRLEDSHATNLRAATRAGQVDTRLRGLIAGQLSSSTNMLGDAERSLAFARDAIAAFRACGAMDDLVSALQAAVEPLITLRRLDEALALVDEALALVPPHGRPGAEWSLQYTLGRVHGAAGDRLQAVAALRRAYERTTPGSVHRLVVPLDIARHLNALGDYAAARDTLDAALAGVPASQPALWAIVAAELGVSLTALGHTARARELQERAATIAEAGDVPKNLFAILAGLAETRRAMGDVAGARAATARLADVAPQLAGSDAGAVLAQQRSRDARAAGDLDEAQRQADLAIAQIEAARDGLRGHALRTAYGANALDYYEDAIGIAMARHATDPSDGHDGDAFLVFERSRARSLADLLGDARVDVHAGLDAALVSRERELQRRLAIADAGIRAAGTTPAAAARVTAFEAEIDAATRELAVLDAQARQASPRYRATRIPPIGSIAGIQALLEGDTVLLAYASQQAAGRGWAITRTGVQTFPLSAREVVDAAVRRLLGALREPAPASLGAMVAADTKPAAEALGALVLGPIAARLRGEWRGRRLAIVSSGSLEYVPFAALIVPGEAPSRWLGEDHEIVSLPSVSVLARLREPRPRRRPAFELAIVADPVYSATDPRIGARRAPIGVTTRRDDGGPVGIGSATRGDFARLVFSRQEARALTALAGSARTVQALDFRASPETIARDVAGARLVHFATHGILDTTRPERSGLVLSLVDPDGRPRDGVLRLNEIFGLSLSAELVVLSGCETGLGRQVRGEGLVGLTRAFMYAGAPRVVSSLWRVDDQATAQLMTRFYRHMLAGGQRPAAALRAAQRELARDPRWAAPYFWAGFVLHGDWR